MQEADEQLSKITDDYEIIIIDDGSTDKTASIVKNYLKRNNRVKYIKHSANLGYGEAIKSGFLSSQKDLIFITDADLQFDLSEISRFYGKIENNNLVIGYRKNRADNFLRKFNSFLWGAFVRQLYGLRVKDINCAFKLMKKDVFKMITLNSSSAAISAELLVKAKNSGCRFCEIPVSHYPRKEGSASGANVLVILRALKELFSIKK